jgi:NADPH2:quinone reductase
MRRYGPPEVLTPERIELVPLAPDEVRIKTFAAAVNHTDLRIRAGDWPVRREQPFPYVPGVEVAGEIVEVGKGAPGELLGARAITMMQGLGGVRAERDGGYAQYVSVAYGAIATLPDDADLAQIAALGLAGVTAFMGLAKLGPLQGRRILITGAAGGVGSAAIGIARAQGAQVAALIGRPEQREYVTALGASTVLLARRGESPKLPAASFDAVLDVVGGALFASLVGALADRGIYSMVGAVGGGDVSFDAWNLIRPVTLTGYSTETLDGRDLACAMQAICCFLSSGRLQAPKWQAFQLTDAALAHAELEKGAVTGRVLLLAS